MTARSVLSRLMTTIPTASSDDLSATPKLLSTHLAPMRSNAFTTPCWRSPSRSRCANTAAGQWRHCKPHSMQGPITSTVNGRIGAIGASGAGRWTPSRSISQPSDRKLGSPPFRQPHMSQHDMGNPRHRPAFGITGLPMRCACSQPPQVMLSRLRYLGALSICALALTASTLQAQQTEEKTPSASG